MKERRSFFRVILVLICLPLLLCGLVSCSGSAVKSGDKDEILEYFRDKMTETLPVTSDTVYWSKNGSVYHLFDDCRFLEKTDEVRHGTVAQSGRSKLCGECAKRTESTAFETEGVADDSVSDTQSVAATSDIAVDHPAYTAEVPPDSTSAPTGDTSTVTQAPDTPHIANEISPGTDTSANPTVDSENKVPSIVYWTPNGSVWHSTADCPSLARSKIINSGTVGQSGKPRGCKKCTSAS